VLGRRNIVPSQSDELNATAGTGTRLPEPTRDARTRLRTSPALRPPRSRDVLVARRARRGPWEPMPFGISQYGAVDALCRLDGLPPVRVRLERGDDGRVRVTGAAPRVKPRVPCFGQWALHEVPLWATEHHRSSILISGNTANVVAPSFAERQSSPARPRLQQRTRTPSEQRETIQSRHHSGDGH
jgi:hypothetical protein